MGYSFENHGMVLNGCALDPSGKDRVGGVILEIDGTPYRAYYGLPMDAVPEVRGNPDLRECGFRREFSQQQLPAGAHRISIRVLTKAGTAEFASGPAQAINVPDWPK